MYDFDLAEAKQPEKLVIRNPKHIPSEGDYVQFDHEYYKCPWFEGNMARVHLNSTSYYGDHITHLFIVMKPEDYKRHINKHR